MTIKTITSSMKIAQILVLLLFSVAPSAFAMGSSQTDLQIRYKITIEIDTPEGIKSGSSVREVRAFRNDRELNPQFPAIEFEVEGEAVVIDLGERGVLFALIDWDSYEELFNAFPAKTNTAIDRLNHGRTLTINQSATLKVNHPRIVKFDDINDVTSINIVYVNKNYVNGDVFIDNFEEVVGTDVDLKKVEIKITDEEISRNIEGYLNFFQPPKNFIRWHRSLRYGDPVTIDRSNFQSKARNSLIPVNKSDKN